MNVYCKRVIGTLRRECTHHLITLSEEHLERLMREYVEYYNAQRTHRALERRIGSERAGQTHDRPKAEDKRQPLHLVDLQRPRLRLPRQLL